MNPYDLRDVSKLSRYEKVELVKHMDIPELMAMRAMGRDWVVAVDNIFVWDNISKQIGCDPKGEKLDGEELKARVQNNMLDVREKARKITDQPYYIRKILEKKKENITIENHQELSKWMNARNEVIVWRAIISSAKGQDIALTDIPDNLDPKASNVVEMSKPFSDWFKENQETLTSLQGLNLESNQLTSLPDAIGNLANLEWLHLDGNQLTSLPDAIGNLANLKLLYLQNNQLTSLPDAIGNLTNLKWLHLQNNQLTSLPDAIEEMENNGLSVYR